MDRQAQARLFSTDRRIRLGVWGLGRGAHVARLCGSLPIDVVAGLDRSDYMRAQFADEHPGALVTSDADEFLQADFDAVLLASFFPSHADDAIACLKAGKHVLSEVTSFFTMGQGVRLVEAVEQSGLVYNLAENYPFTAANDWIARKWQDGLFGDLMYAEYEYVHEILTLAFADINGKPLVPGNRMHAWRSWLSFHYYNTHSLGPVMRFTGERPTRVVSLPCARTLPGYPAVVGGGMGSVSPSLIRMSGGALVRNLMGGTTNDSHMQRLWGMRGAAEIIDDRVCVRLGACGGGLKAEVRPSWSELGPLAGSAGHGGGDFWVLYFFCRQILTGEKAPFDIYTAADCTIPGILAYRSQAENGKPYDVPDFRDAKQRDVWRMDDVRQPSFDPSCAAFGPGVDTELSRTFDSVMCDLVNGAHAYCAYHDWKRITADMVEPTLCVRLADDLLGRLTSLNAAQEAAQRIIAAYPATEAARMLREVLAQTDVATTGASGFGEALRAERAALAALYGEPAG